MQRKSEIIEKEEDGGNDLKRARDTYREGERKKGEKYQ